jgi:multidrug resistance efflux pump
MKIQYIILLAAGLIAVIVGASLYGYGRWDNSRTFVSTGDAQVVADLVQVGSSNAGRIIAINVEEGDPILEGQVIATVDIATVISRSDTTDTAKMGFRDVQDQRAEVLAPRSGVIVARWAEEGDTLPAGQPIVTLMDPREIWVVANVKEGDVKKVQQGQIAEVKIDSFDPKLVGTVDRISRVTADTVRPDQNGSNSVNRPSQVVSVRIALNERQPSLIPGSSANVKIRIR